VLTACMNTCAAHVERPHSIYIYSTKIDTPVQCQMCKGEPMRRVLLIVVLVGMLMMLAQPAYAKTLYVGNGGYSSIQDAINNASNGDTVYVYNGLYEEHVVLNKSITLKGQSTANTVVSWDEDDVINITAAGAEVRYLTVQGAPPYHASVRVLADNVKVRDCILQNSSYGLIAYASGCTIQDNTARYNTRYGIAIIGSSSGTLKSNNASNNTLAGIFIHDSQDISVKDSTIKYNELYGLYLGNANSCEVRSNTITFNRYGVWLRKSDSNELKYNNVSNNTRYGVLLTDSTAHVDGSDDNTITSNDINGNVGGVYVYNSDGNLIKDNVISHNTIHGCILLAGSTDNTIRSNTIRYNRYGIELAFSSGNLIKTNTLNDNVRVGVMLVAHSNNNTVEDNTAKRCHYGAYVHDSQGNTIKKGEFSDGSVGIYLGNTTYTLITDNNANHNTYGIYLRKSSYNTITGNVANSNANYSYMIDLHSNENVLSDNRASHSTKGSLYIGHSTHNTVSEEDYSDGTFGVMLLNANSNSLTGCTIHGDLSYGIYILMGSKNNTIAQCTIHSPSKVGMVLDETEDSHINYTTITQPEEYGIVITESAHDNSMYENTITLPKDKNAKGVYISGDGNFILQNEIKSDKPSAVDGIYVNASGMNYITGNTLDHLVSGIWVVKGDTQHITNNEITSCSYGIQLWNDVKNTYIHGNHITTTNAGIAVMGDVSNYTNTPTNTTVLNNTLDKNTIDVEFLWGTPTASVNYNDLAGGITGVAATGVVNTTIDATYNWWGAPDGPGPIANGHGVKVSANVTYEPWLTSPP